MGISLAGLNAQIGHTSRPEMLSGCGGCYGLQLMCPTFDTASETWVYGVDMTMSGFAELRAPNSFLLVMDVDSREIPESFDGSRFFRDDVGCPSSPEAGDVQAA